MDFEHLRTVAAEHPYPLLFVTVSGAHLYGFPSRDSDVDVRGAHVLAVESLAGIERGEETVQWSRTEDGVEVDLVTHDAAKYFRLLLKPNGYVLEQVYSPLVVHTTPGFEELKHAARGCITRGHVRHYLGFARNQWARFEADVPRRVKPLLYVYRVLLTGIHLMRTGAVEANLLHLNDEYRLPYVPELIERKLHGGEQSGLGEADVAYHAAEYSRLLRLLDEAGRDSGLPARPTAGPALHALAVRTRMNPAPA
jgi:uncharacterized protein